MTRIRALFAGIVLFIALLFATPLLTEAESGPLGEMAIVAVASFPVAVHEELFFRGVLQTMLVKRLGAFRGLSLAAICFLLFHVGVTPPDAMNFLHVGLGGACLVLLFHRTGSLAAVMAGACCLAVECDETRVDFRLRTRYVDAKAHTLDEALAGQIGLPAHVFRGTPVGG